MINILSWNIRQGGGSRVRTILKKIANLKAEILVLTEYQNNDNGQILRGGLLKIGYRHQYVSDASKKENSVLVVSKIPAAVEWTPSQIVDFKHNLLWVKFSAFTLIGGYFPHKKKHKLFEAVNAYAEASDAPLIVVGDYNTGINHVDQLGKSFWYQDQLAKMSELGLKDAFRYINGKDCKEYSWYSHQGNGYRYDHSYVSEDLLPVVTECFYLHDWREEKLSDHSPMLLKLG